MYLYQFEAFTTPCELHIDAPSNALADDIAQSIMLHTKQLEHRYSFFRDTSEVYAVNHRYENTQIISEEFTGLIQMALFYHKVTQGIFDIALAGTLKASLKASSLEEYQQLRNQFLPFASCESIRLAGNHLTFSNDYTKIDFGGLVKEYAVDQAVLQLQTFGITSALVNFGGDIAAFGTCHNNPWNIGIQNPNDSNNNLMEVEINNRSLCTSGYTKRFTTIENRNIPHIISNSATYGDNRQISIMAPTTVDAGIWSTTLLINPTLTIPAHIHLIHTTA